MKRIFSLLICLLAFVALQAQPSWANRISSQTSGSFTAPNYVYIGGTSADTLYASDTLIYSIRVNYTDVQTMKIRLYIDKVTGTVSDTCYFYGSFDGTTKDAAIDSIFNSNVSDGYKYLNTSRWTTFGYPYILIWQWDKGGARTGVKSVRRVDIFSKNY